MKSIFLGLWQPIAPESVKLLAQRWKELPPYLKHARQIVGRHWVQCAFTTGPTYCSFGCTHCYLPADANRAPLPTFDAIKSQLNANRSMLGPGGHVQITGGDVVDAYLRAGRFDELVQICAHATAIDLVPMLMTHGQAFLRSPPLLERLVTDGRLRKISIHIDITQAGRDGFNIRHQRTERQLNPLRDQFRDLILAVRRKTGKRLVGAQTVTVSRKNIDSIGDILTWYAADRRNLKAFRTLSLQTEAHIGRTRIDDRTVSPDEVWDRVSRHVGNELCRDILWFGHPDCSSLSMLLVDTKARRFMELMPDTPASRKFWEQLVAVFGGLGGRGSDSLGAAARKISLLIRNPLVASRTSFMAIHLLRRSTNRFTWLTNMARGKVGVVKIVLHNFIDHDDLVEPCSQRVQDRLAACSFRGAVKVNGQWRAIPMCQMNAHYR